MGEAEDRSRGRGHNIVPTSSSTLTKESTVADYDHHPPESSSPPPSFSTILRMLSLGLLSASPTLLLIRFGARTSLPHVCIYIGLLLVPPLCARKCDVQSGIMRWILGFVLLIVTSSFKSGFLLASCDGMVMKGVLYAITALWECSNVVLIIGGKDLLRRYNIDRDGPSDIVLLALAPCQVKFIPRENDTNGIDNNLCSLSSGRSGRRFVHITTCLLGASGLYFALVSFQTIRTVVTSFVLIELEILVLMSSMAVVILDIPSHLWQVIHDLLASTSWFAPSYSVHQLSTTTPKVILPYGWIYTSKSTREFWSRWSRPAMQLIRHLFYYPLGGRDRWYLSIPIMFLINASSHFDLSYALVGDRAEVY
eukprot:CAMPEP_0181112356 /NCGR_PEP_ID=MMETSP1071-20121207/19774_1 /TAXON_ID=35127 /ORGANISM="Thalassiosira sp., Strain NH16" /LENGTH=365 /DNA_ID=CAMNT_0023196329 /DNA_START=231 /DNA_END=1328 /DNA_ORIENTATION=-